MPYVQSEKMFLYSLHRGARSRGLQAGPERGSSSQISMRGGDMNYRMRRVVRASIRDSIRRPWGWSWLPPFIAAGRKPGVHKRATCGADYSMTYLLLEQHGVVVGVPADV